MKIYFHSNGALVDSPYFSYSWRFPPVGIIYVGNRGYVSDVILDMKKQRFFKMMVGLGKTLLNMVGKSAVNISNIPDGIGEIDLIHSLNTIPNTTKPYVIELESFHSLFIGGAMDTCSINKITELLSKSNCKKIIFWTKNAYDNFHILMLNDTLKEKSIILYPAVPLNVQNKFHKKPTIGFIARDFFSKGGDLVLPVMKDFVKSNRAKAVVVSDLDLIKDKSPESYKLYSPYIDFKQLMPRDKLYKTIFPNIDILFYPGYSDSYGFIFPEASSFGIPIITIDGVARRELVHSGKGGYVIFNKLSKYGFPFILGEKEKDQIRFDLNFAVTNLVCDGNLRKSMSDYNYNLAKRGIFSIKKRNTAMLNVYKDAIKD